MPFFPAQLLGGIAGSVVSRLSGPATVQAADGDPIVMGTTNTAQTPTVLELPSTLPGPGASSLARDGVVLFALLHRALNDGASSLGNARQRIATNFSLRASAGQYEALYRELGPMGAK